MSLVLGVVVLFLGYFAIKAFGAANPRALALTMKRIGGLALLGFAAFIGLRGEIALAIPLGAVALGLLGWGGLPFGLSWPGSWPTGASRTPGQASRVRSAMLEMELDHDTGALRGRVVAGREAGRDLESFSLAELLAFRADLDAESLALIEAYLDRRFPAWRQHAEADAATGRGRAAAGGKMTEEEAYQILGLEPGAGRAEIARAHRALMKKLHPDQGGSTFLAAKVNEARDLLFGRHH